MDRSGKKNFIKVSYAVLFFAVLAVVLSALAAQSLGWLNPEEKAQSDVVVSDFKVAGQGYFKDVAATNLENISISNQAVDRYLENMKYKVKYEGISPAYLRVQILEQWVDKRTDTIIDTPFTAYQIVGDDWYDNRANDNCYYYKGLVGPELITSAAIQTAQTVQKEMVLFDGVDMGAIQGSDATTELTLIIEVQAVQPNRYREFWNMEHLPWEK